MAPTSCPEEIDVFTVPHSRMKELVHKYLDMISWINFTDVVHLTNLLENLYDTFKEFKAHEQIENKFIMKKLKNKLKALSIHNTAVCNCHKDNKLTEMLELVQDGYKCTKKTDWDRKYFGSLLQQKLEDFTQEFIPHMEEEEEVFQPLLMKYFTFDELKEIKATVLEKHFSSDYEQQSTEEKQKEDYEASEVPEEDDYCTQKSIEDLPDEVMLRIMSHLNPRDLCRSAQVSHRWNRLALDPALWTQLYPAQWARGCWDVSNDNIEEEEERESVEEILSKKFDEDADVDESEDAGVDSEAIKIQEESKMLMSICKHLLPRVGPAVKLCNLAYSKGITNGSLYKLLSKCPNLEFLDLTQTRVSDLGFKGFQHDGCGKKLKHLNLTGCLFITDTTLQRLSTSLGQVPCHMTIGVKQKDEGVKLNKTKRETELKQDDKLTVEKSGNKDEMKEELGGNSVSLVMPENEDITSSNQEFRENQEEDKKGNCTERDCFCVQKCHSLEDINKTRTTCCRDKGVSCRANKESQGHGEGGGLGVFVTKPRTKLIPLPHSPPGPKEISMQIDKNDKTFELMYYDACDKTISQLGNSQVQPGQDQTVLNSLTNLTRFLKKQVANKTFNEVLDPPDGEVHRGPTSDGMKDNVPDKKLVTLGNLVPNSGNRERGLVFLSLSGCYKITDDGLRSLAENGGLPYLEYLDLSGCLNLTGDGLTQLVDTCTSLDQTHLYYCDNIMDGPFSDTASGCRNLQCMSLACCRSGE